MLVDRKVVGIVMGAVLLRANVNNNGILHLVVGLDRPATTDEDSAYDLCVCYHSMPY